MTNTCLHFVGFKDDRYHNAVKVFGQPHYIHPGWDLRAFREIAPGDVIVFANGDDSQTPRTKSFTDYVEKEPK